MSRRRRRTPLLAVVAAFIAVPVALARTPASEPLAAHAGAARFPVIGCDDPKYPYANHYGWAYAPTGFCRTSRGNGVEGIDHTHWRSWGKSHATGRGYLVVYNQAVEEYPAIITAYGFWSTDHFAGINEHLSAYSHLHVQVLSRLATGGPIRWRGLLNVTLNVQIQE
jgi:hypothetical protein